MSLSGPNHEHPAECLRVIDGDTYLLRFELDFECDRRATVRLRGVDAWETKGAEREQGLAARWFVGLLVRRPTSVPLIARSHLTKKGSEERDKYGRYLVDIQLPDGRDLAALLVAEGHARAWDG